MTADHDHGGWRMLGRELRAHSRALPRLLGWSVIEAVPSLCSGWLVAAATDQGFVVGRPWIGAAWLAGMAIAQLLRTYATRALMPHLAGVVEPVRDALVTRVVTGALHHAVRGRSRPDAAALARLTEQVSTIRGLLAALLTQGRAVLIRVTTAVIGLTALAPTLAALVTGTLAVTLVLFALTQRGLRARQRALLVADEQLAHAVVDVLDGLRDVVVCDAQARVASDIGGLVDIQAHQQRRLATAESHRHLVTALAQYGPVMALLAAVVSSPVLLPGSQLGIGAILGAVTYVVVSLQPAVGSLLETWGGIGTQLSVTLDRIATTSATPESPPPSHSTEPLGHELRIEALNWAYGSTAESVIDDLSLTVAEDEHLALIGPSGIGKSTLADLVTGSLPAPHGTIRLGGVALPDIAEDRLHGLIAVVPQEAYIFPATVRENLRYLAPHATDRDLDRSATAVGATELITRLGGYDTELGTAGPALTAADRQLLALTRVHASNARLVVLDEATSHLDVTTETLAEQAFRARPGNLIIIAHRMSSAHRADRVLVMDGERTITGTHADLLDTSTLYRELLNHWNGTQPRQT